MWLWQIPVLQNINLVQIILLAYARNGVAVQTFIQVSIFKKPIKLFRWPQIPGRILCVSTNATILS
uniref:Uncharacterized protein n=1 Tax=Arundo donax TaxID=35708 RepID=A0A0A9CWW5_ARUDO